MKAVISSSLFVLILSYSILAQDVIRFGISLSLTPEGTSRQSTSLRVADGIEFFLRYTEEIGPIDVGGVSHTVEVVILDEANVLENCQQNYAQLGSDPNIHFLLGPILSDFTLGSLPMILAANKVTMSTTSASEAFYQSSKNLFTPLTPAAQTYQNVILEMGFRGAKTVYSIAENHPYQLSVCSIIPSFTEDYGLDFMGRIDIPYTETEVSDETAKAVSKALNKLEKEDPDVVLICGFNAIAEYILEQAKKKDYFPRAFASTPLWDTWLDVDKDIGEWHVGTTQWSPDVRYDSDPGLYGSAQEFTKKFTEMFGHVPDSINALGAVAPLIVLQGIRNAGTLDTNTVAEHIARLDLNTFYGKVRFTSEGGNQVETVMIQSRDNKLVPVGPARARVTDLVYPTPSWTERTYDPEWFEYTVEIVMASISGGCMVISLIFILIVIRYWNHDVIKASTPLFCIIILVGTLVVYSSVYTWMIYENDATCAALPWVLGVGFVLVYGSLMAKTWRIAKIFINKNLQVIKITNLQLLLIVGALLAIQCALLALWSIIDIRSSKVVVNDEDRPEYNDTICSWSTVDQIFSYIIGGYWLILLFTGTIFAFKIRNVTYVLYNESKLIGFAVYNIFICAILVVTIQASNLDDEQLSFVITTGGILAAGLVTTLTLFVPKVYFIWIGKHSVRSSAVHSFKKEIASTTLNSDVKTSSTISV